MGSAGGDSFCDHPPNHRLLLLRVPIPRHRRTPFSVLFCFCLSRILECERED